MYIGPWQEYKLAKAIKALKDLQMPTVREKEVSQNPDMQEFVDQASVL